MSQSPTLKVPEDQFKAVIKALLNTPPMTMAGISPKKTKAPQAKTPKA
jgi:hypothetical protein